LTNGNESFTHHSIANSNLLNAWGQLPSALGQLEFEYAIQLPEGQPLLAAGQRWGGDEAVLEKIKNEK
jgi:hypothetical protein